MSTISATALLFVAAYCWIAWMLGVFDLLYTRKQRRIGRIILATDHEMQMQLAALGMCGIVALGFAGIIFTL